MAKLSSDKILKQPSGRRAPGGAGHASSSHIKEPHRASGADRAGLTGEALLSEAEGLEVEQQAILEGASLDQSYSETLAMHIQAKHDQVESIEGRLENLIDRQQARIQQSQASRPGFLAMPGARNQWQASQSKQQARLHSLHARLDSVKEIKEGMGLHSPRIEELATRKMRADNPELASDWDAMQEAQRRHQVMQKQQELEKKHKQEKSHSLSLGLGRSPL